MYQFLCQAVQSSDEFRQWLRWDLYTHPQYAWRQARPIRTFHSQTVNISSTFIKLSSSSAAAAAVAFVHTTMQCTWLPNKNCTTVLFSLQYEIQTIIVQTLYVLYLNINFTDNVPLKCTNVSQKVKNNETYLEWVQRKLYMVQFYWSPCTTPNWAHRAYSTRAD